MRYLYLHGFTAGPSSHKGRFFRDRLAALGLELERLDFNEGGFENLTLTRQVEQTERAIAQGPPGPVCLIGSSFGGLTAAWVAERAACRPTTAVNPIASLVLLAPAFGFPRSWGETEPGATELAAWEAAGTRLVYHHAEARDLPLKYEFWRDSSADHWQAHHLQHPVPTLIVHGQQDEVIPLTRSQDYARDRPWVKLMAIPGDHALMEASDVLWQAAAAFWQQL